VPFPAAVDDHQARNAEFLVAAGAAEMLRASAAFAERIAAARTARGGGFTICDVQPVAQVVGS